MRLSCLLFLALPLPAPALLFAPCSLARKDHTTPPQSKEPARVCASVFVFQIAEGQRPAGRRASDLVGLAITGPWKITVFQEASEG